MNEKGGVTYPIVKKIIKVLPVPTGTGFQGVYIHKGEIFQYFS